MKMEDYFDMLRKLASQNDNTYENYKTKTGNLKNSPSKSN